MEQRKENRRKGGGKVKKIMEWLERERKGGREEEMKGGKRDSKRQKGNSNKLI